MTSKPNICCQRPQTNEHVPDFRSKFKIGPEIATVMLPNVRRSLRRELRSAVAGHRRRRIKKHRRTVDGACPFGRVQTDVDRLL